MRYPAPLQKLIDNLSKLPSVGPKTAERYAFFLLKQDPKYLEELSSSISNIKSDITICHNCLSISEKDPCSICIDDKRVQKTICVIENNQDLALIEATKQFNGKYFILGGLINAINGIGPEKLNIKRLISKIEKENIEEIILALNFTLEGETTAMYLNKILKDKVKISRLAKGLPAGSNLEYADEITLASAFKNRS
ncbi:MAG: recombination mediator RecR [Patescibacteria group bacterium]|jgi:recombination protein RecR|nr:recombination mediator RecR [Patescibacteria group bacterium]